MNILLTLMWLLPAGATAAEAGASERRESLARLGLTPLEIGSAAPDIPASSFDAAFLSTDGPNGDFSNIQDLEWLRPVARRRRIVFLGERHFFAPISNLRDRILFALNAYDRFPLLVLEMPYSEGLLMDFYVGLEDDSRAEAFYASTLAGRGDAKAWRPLLDRLRSWNKSHPGRRIRIAGHDIEHDFRRALRQVVIPCVRSIDPSFELDPEKIRVRDLEGLLPTLRAKIGSERAGRASFPYRLTKNGVMAVLDGLAPLPDYVFNGNEKARLKAMTRNLLASDRLGCGTADKCLIYGGIYHAATRFSGASRESAYADREGAALAKAFPGDVFSIFVDGLAFSLGAMADADADALAALSGVSDWYARQLKALQTASRQGLIGMEECVRADRALDAFERAVARAAGARARSFVMLGEVRWKSLPGDLQGKKRNLDLYDATIYLPCGPLLPMGPVRVSAVAK